MTPLLTFTNGSIILNDRVVEMLQRNLIFMGANMEITPVRLVL